MSKFKVGDKVIMPKWKRDDRFGNFMLESESNVPVNDAMTIRLVTLEGKEEILGCVDKNGKHIVGYVLSKFVEPFIEQGFEIGLKFKMFGRNLQIVRAALNKKKKYYSYMCFDLQNGDGFLIAEPAMPKTKKIDEVEVMTLAQVCKKLGKNIKIIN